MNPRSRFWADLEEDLKDPEFHEEYVRASEEIALFDAMKNEGE